MSGISIDFAPVSKTYSTVEPIDHDTALSYNNIVDVDEVEEETDETSEQDLMDELKFTDPELWDEYARSGDV